MRYSPDQKEKTRRRIVETSARAFRRDGLAASGLNSLMAEAGLKPASFYPYFEARDDLVSEALAMAFDETRRLIASRSDAAGDSGRPPLACIIDGYLSARHLDSPEASCAVAALGPEFCRQADAVRRTARNGVETLVEAIQAEVAGHDRGTASAILALMAGTIQLARAATLRSEALAFLESGRRGAYLLGGLSPDLLPPAAQEAAKVPRKRRDASN
jgi:TetR/AcrR family transcriptional repressor of nem operon